MHQFDAPLTITVRYTQDQLAARSIAAADLTLFWFDTTAQQWIAVPTVVDPIKETATAQVDHFTEFELSDGSSPSKAFIPSVEGFQTSLFTGAATYDLPIEVPAGPAGIKPALTLSYNSTATDGATGTRAKQQAGWAGKGWSLDTGSIAAYKTFYTDYGKNYVYYNLVLNGQAFQLARGAALTSTATITDPTGWDWRSTNESFIRARVISNGRSGDHDASIPIRTLADYDSETQSQYGRGGILGNTTWQPRYTWLLWAKDGTRYEFSEDLWWGWNRCADLEYDFDAYKWLLSKVVDPHGNTITYRYNRQSWVGGLEECVADHPDRSARGTADRDAWLSSITWGGNPQQGTPDRYRVIFDSVPREDDVEFDQANAQYGGQFGAPRETRRLRAVRVESNASGSWEQVREYRLNYDASQGQELSQAEIYSLYSDSRACGTTYVCPQRKLTLRRVQVLGKDGTPLPATTFTYGTDPGTEYYALGDWNRLTQVTNGQGGTITLRYENIGKALDPVNGNGAFVNNQRLTSKTLDDGRGQLSTWSYSYGNPNYNVLGATLGGPEGWTGTKPNPNSAVLYLNKYLNPANPNYAQMAQPALREFRGHDYVKETDPTGTQREHWFYQGDLTDAECGYPKDSAGNPLTGAALYSDACFLKLRDRELLKGREYRTRVLTPANEGSAVLQEVQRTFAVQFYSHSDVVNGETPNAGLWRAFPYENATTTILSPATSGEPAQSQTTRYFYNPDCIPNVVGNYGNLGCTQEYGAAAPGAIGALERTTKQYYAMRDDATTYIVDRAWGEVVSNGQNQLEAVTHRFYDNQPTPTTIGTLGDLTLERRYYAGITSSSVLTGTDTYYGYDAWGNQIVERTFADPGLYNTSTQTWSPDRTGVPPPTARTTTTTYDPVFHAFPISISNPLSQVDQADYDYRMGTLTSVTDANGNVTQAGYDPFGRMTALIKPGDSLQYPTVELRYYDMEQPVRYQVCRRAVAGQSACRSTQTFYDGLGRNLQTKQESLDGMQNIVADTVYDALGRAIKTTQPRYVTETSTSFTQYTPLPATGVYSTTTTYDALDRPLVVTQPDGKQIVHHYGGVSVNSVPLAYDDVIDQNRHRTQSRMDAFGRLVQVAELTGDCSNAYWTPTYQCLAPYTTSWATYATTAYTYSPLDLLTTVTDAKGNVTSMSYDSAGRKTQMTDPDMGTWRYAYDPNGNLQTQTDAKGQTLWFGYDALDRLTEKRIGSATGTILASYGYDAPTSSNGKGQRTSMSAGNASTTWQYDARGRKTQAQYNVNGLTRTFGWSYDNGDRMTTMTYPSGEVTSFTYNDAWQPTELTGSLGDYYVTDANYNAAGQLERLAFNDNATNQWLDYDPATQRLLNLSVDDTNPDNGVFLDLGYTYDAAGNITTITDRLRNEVQHFTYDERDRLTRAWTTAGASAMATPPSAQLASAFSTPRVAGSGGRRLTRTPATADLQPDLAQTLDAATGVDPMPLRADAAPVAQSSTAAAPVQTPPLAPTTPVTATTRPLPLQFVENKGQTDSQVRFLGRGRGGTLFFTPDEAVLAMADARPGAGRAVVRLQAIGARPAPTIRPRLRLPGVANDMLGNDPAQWKTNQPTYAGVAYEQIYDGIDLFYEGIGGTLKRTYQVAPGADPSQIRWRYAGATDVTIDGQGNLVVTVPAPTVAITATTPPQPAPQAGREPSGATGPASTPPVTATVQVTQTLTEAAPVVWQMINGKRVPVPAQYTVDQAKRVGLTLGSYDPAYRLVIDPVLTYSRTVGGSGTDEGNAITVNAAGEAYVVGSTGSVDFPTQNPQQGAKAGGADAFVAKLSADGGSYVWSTYLGGSGDDKAAGVALDSSGRVAVVGETESSNFPTKNGYDTSYGGGTCSGGPCDDVFAAELTADGSSLRYATYLGGGSDDEGAGVAVDSGGNILLTGRANSGYPTRNAYQSTFGGGWDMVVSKINPGASGSASLLYSTFLGGTATERGYAIAVDSSNNVYVAGSSYNSGFPMKNAYDSTHNGNADVLVVKLNPATSGTASLLYSTYLGGSGGEEGLGIAADNAGNAYVTGYASSGFPTVNAAQATYGGSKDAFVAKLNTTVSGSAGLVSSTYLGGSGEDQGLAITLAGTSQVAITGLTRSDDYPTKNPTQATRGGDSCTTLPCKDAVVSQLDLAAAPANQLTFSTYLGGASDEEGRGIARTSDGALYVAGVTFSATSGGNGQSDAFVSKIAPDASTSGPAPYDETYTYDSIGNLTSKAGVSYGYGANGNGTGAGPHQARTVGVQSYQYDANGNLTSGGGRTLTWDSENRPSSVTANGLTESYTYDADGERVTKTRGGVTTLYLEGVWEEVVGGATTSYYRFNGQTVAMRDSVTTQVSYLVSDQLGSVSLLLRASASGEPLVSQQYFMPWGQVRGPGITQTSLNYTGQRLDGTGLLYYHARYYDPALARFVSADSVVPQPSNPQAFNRYSYVLNNPVNLTDPTGFCTLNGNRVIDIGKLDCDVSVFETFTAQQRLTWLDDFSRLSNSDGWFNNVKDIITYFVESPTLRHLARGSWASMSDAAVIEAIQNGYALFRGGQPASSGAGAGALLAAGQWQRFFAARARDPNAIISVKPLWAQAEQAGVEYGIRYADRQVGRPGGVEGRLINNFVKAGNLYRGIAGNYLGGAKVGCAAGAPAGVTGCAGGAVAGEWFTTPSSRWPLSQRGPTYTSAWIVEKLTVNVGLNL